MAIDRHHAVRLPGPPVDGLAPPRGTSDRHHELPQRVQLHLGEHPAQCIGAGLPPADPAVSAPGPAQVLLEQVEAPQPQDEQRKPTQPHGGRGDLRPLPRVL